MTEAEWTTCAKFQSMLDLLRGRVHARKLRLFGVGCCRSIWHLFTDPRSRKLVELAERVADDPEEWKSVQVHAAGAREAMEQVFGPMTGLRHELQALLIDERAACAAVFFLIWRMEISAYEDTSEMARYTAGRLGESGALRVCNVLRCVVGNPFRPATLDPSWLAWNDGAIRKLAQSIYDDRAFARLPLLANALEDAGCADAAILGHCRGGGEHVRGCWAVDLLLGKE